MFISNLDTEELRYWTDILLQRLNRTNVWNRELLTDTGDGADILQLIPKMVSATKERDELIGMLKQAKTTAEILKEYYLTGLPEKPNAYLDDEDEYYDKVVVCKDCGCRFIGEYCSDRVARYCPSCGHKLRLDESNK